MSVKEDNLFALIRSLSPSEKRFFKSFVQGGTNQQDLKYLQLFDTLSRQKTYDEEALLKTPGFDNKPNRLAVAKNYLFQLILKALRNSGSDKTTELFVLEMLLDLELLYNRRMFGPAAKLAEKARKMAEKFLHYDLLITIADWERRLTEQLEDANKYSDFYEAILERESFFARQLQLNSIYFNQYKKLYFSNHRDGCFKWGVALDEFLSLLRYPELEDYSSATNPLAKVYFNLCYNEYFLSIRDYHNRYEINKQLVNLFAENPNLIKRSPLEYLKSLVSFLTCQTHLRLFDEFDQNIKKLDQLIFPKYAHDLHRYKKVEYMHLVLKRYYVTGEFRKAIEETVPLIEAYYGENNHQMIYREEFFLRWEVAWAYLGIRDYEKALEWIIPLEMQTDNDFFVDHYTVYSLILMMIYYETNDAKALNDHADALLDYLKSKHKMGSSEAFLIRFFQLACEDLTDKKKQKKLLLQLKEQSQTVKRYLQAVPVYPLDTIIWWVDSILQNKPLEEVYREFKMDAVVVEENTPKSKLSVFPDLSLERKLELNLETELVG